MKIFSGFWLMLVLMAFPGKSYGQGFFSYDYLSPSTLQDELGNKYGSGGMQIVSGGYSIPVSMKRNERGQLTAWSANVNATYATLANQGEAKGLNPGNIFNGGLSLSHIRPIGRKWSMIALLGGGIYAPANEISMKSLLANGGVIFVYKLNKNVDLGVGAGLTNSYGTPMILPMLYFSWQRPGKYEFKVDMSNGLKVSASTRLNKWLKVDLVGIEMDGMSAVMKMEGKSKIYSTVMLKSYLSPSVSLNKKTSLYLGVGGNWVRGISVTDRSLKAFFDSFKEDDEDPFFRVALRLSGGIRYSF